MLIKISLTVEYFCENFYEILKRQAKINLIIYAEIMHITYELLDVTYSDQICAYVIKITSGGERWQIDELKEHGYPFSR